MEELELSNEEMTKVFSLYLFQKVFRKKNWSKKTVEYLTIEHLWYPYNSGVFFAHLELIPYSKITEEQAGRGFSDYESYMHLISMGVEVPLYCFGKRHWANGKTAFDLGLAEVREV